MTSIAPGLITIAPEVRIMILDHLSTKDLYHVVSTCRSIHPDAERLLYLRNARHDTSSAILWAANSCSNSGYRAATLRTLELSLTYGGDVNALHTKHRAFATALHIATANASVAFVRMLLDAGADPHARSFKMWLLMDFKMRVADTQHTSASLRSFAVTKQILNHHWLPLLPAVYTRNFPMITFLTEAGCSPYLAIDPGNMPLFHPPLRTYPLLDEAYTIYHMIIEENMSMMSCWGGTLRRFHLAVSVLDPVQGMSILMKAAKKGDVPLVQGILQLGPDVNILSLDGLSALSYAVQGAFDEQVSRRQREGCTRVIKLLLERNACPNAGRETFPLRIVCNSYLQSAVFDNRLAEFVVDELLDNGADVNAQLPSGLTLSYRLFLFLVESNRASKRLEELFFEFVEHKAQVNLFPGGDSMLWNAMHGENFKTLKVADFLLAHGARLCPLEVNQVFLDWVGRVRKYPQTLDMSDYVDHVAPEVMDKAFVTAVERMDKDRYDWLQEWCEPCRVPEELVATAIQNKCKFRDEIFTMDFDASWTDSNGRSFAHLVVEGIQARLYSEKEALRDMETLLNKGVKLGHRDARGFTAHGRLKMIQKKDLGLVKLELLMSRAQLYEDGHL